MPPGSKKSQHTKLMMEKTRGWSVFKSGDLFSAADLGKYLCIESKKARYILMTMGEAEVIHVREGNKHRYSRKTSGSEISLNKLWKATNNTGRI